jgi:hypothetical protein
LRIQSSNLKLWVSNYSCVKSVDPHSHTRFRRLAYCNVPSPIRASFLLVFLLPKAVSACHNQIPMCLRTIIICACSLCDHRVFNNVFILIHETRRTRDSNELSLDFSSQYFVMSAFTRWKGVLSLRAAFPPLALLATTVAVVAVTMVMPSSFARRFFVTRTSTSGVADRAGVSSSSSSDSEEDGPEALMTDCFFDIFIASWLELVDELSDESELDLESDDTALRFDLFAFESSLSSSESDSELELESELEEGFLLCFEIFVGSSSSSSSESEVELELELATEDDRFFSLKVCFVFLPFSELETESDSGSTSDSSLESELDSSEDSSSSSTSSVEESVLLESR